MMIRKASNKSLKTILGLNDCQVPGYCQCYCVSDSCATHMT